MIALKIEIVNVDALEYPCDVLVMKYAQRAMGLDAAVIAQLTRHHRSFQAQQLPKPQEHLLLSSEKIVSARDLLFVGVPNIRSFRYEQIREFATRTLSVLNACRSDVQHMAVTIHGVGYGLDEIESFRSQIHGFLDAISAGDYPGNLKKISIVEQDTRRTRQLQQVLEDMLSEGLISLEKVNIPNQMTPKEPPHQEKPHVFVAMPFSDAMEDVFYYGIQSSVHAAGLLCERTDITPFTGEIIERIKDRIGTSEFVIADMTHANPNVYLEVGYAWGRGKRTILISADLSHLHFDVKGHKCIEYKSIRELEKKLQVEMDSLLKKK